MSEDTIVWTVRISDPNVYTAPWVISKPLTLDSGYKMYEYACHEGSWAIPNVLSGQREFDVREMSDPDSRVRYGRSAPAICGKYCRRLGYW